MPLNQELETTGNWLFRYRSYLPILFFPILIYFQNDSSQTKPNATILILSIIISYLGELIRIITAAFVEPGTSGRNTKQQYAITLNTTGIYSIVRHPLYLGNYLIFLGPCIYVENVNLLIIYSLTFWLYYERIMYAEEAFLCSKFKNEFLKWAMVVPAFFPSFKLYKKPNSNFSLRKILEREYTGVCGIIFMYALLIVGINIAKNENPIISDTWLILFIINLIMFFCMRGLKKYWQK